MSQKQAGESTGQQWRLRVALVALLIFPHYYGSCISGSVGASQCSAGGGAGCLFGVEALALPVEDGPMVDHYTGSTFSAGIVALRRSRAKFPVARYNWV